ncbi:MAG: ATP-binding protein, partial [Gemmatimonadaceae bacterium]
MTTDLASVFRAACERAGLRLIVDCPPLSEPVFVDAEMWEKVVLNLLSNAFKFTFEGEIVVSMRCAGTAIELEVTDTGTGIPAEEMPRLFERFHRVRDARGRTHEGSGIGLALVQELVKLHGGSISAESRVGAGTTFVVSLPLGSAHLPADQVTSQLGPAMVDTAASPFIEEAMRWFPDDPSSKDVIVSELTGIGNSLEVPRPQRPAHENDTRPLVLIADDNADMRQYVARLLGKQYRVETVADGEAALIAVRARTPDLVLTDVMMPRLDGLGLLKALRAGPETRAIPVILLSARAGEELRSEGLEAGADDYMVKPFSARELRARVGANLQMARLRRETDQALFQRGEQFMTLIDRAPLGVYLIDADFRVREVNPIAQSFFGDHSGGIVGRDFAEVIHILWDTEYADEVVDIFRSTLETGESYVAPERARFRIDRQITEYYEWRLDRILLPDGRNGLVCYFRDISPQVNARLSIAEFAERLRLALDAAALGTFIWHLQEDRAEPDAQMRSLLGLSSEEHLSKASALATMIPSDDATRYRAAVARAIDPAGSGTLREDVRVVHPDGSEHWLAITGQTFFQGEPPVAVRMAGTASDITDRKRREANLEFLAESQDLFASLTSAAEIVQAVGTKLGVYLRASTCYFVDIDDTRDGARFEYIWDVEGSPRIPASIHTSDFVSGDFNRALRIGEVVIVRDSDCD